MAIYEESLTEVSTPFSSFETEFTGEVVEAWWSRYNEGQKLLPIFLALITISFFIIVRPKVASNDLSQTNGNSTSLGEATDLNTSTENLETKIEQVSDVTSNPGESGSILSPVFTKEVRYWEPQIMRWSAEYGVDPNIVATIMQIESCGNPDAESYAGAKGLFQVMPFHFAVGESMLDPDTNAMRGLNFFNRQMQYTNGNILLSLAGYNGGYAASGGNYASWPSETQRYYYWAKGLYEEADSGLGESPTLAEWLSAGGAAGCQIAATRLGL
jgi:hypothetical protein